MLRYTSVVLGPGLPLPMRGVLICARAGGSRQQAASARASAAADRAAVAAAGWRRRWCCGCAIAARVGREAGRSFLTTEQQNQWRASKGALPGVPGVPEVCEAGTVSERGTSGVEGALRQHADLTKMQPTGRSTRISAIPTRHAYHDQGRSGLGGPAGPAAGGQLGQRRRNRAGALPVSCGQPCPSWLRSLSPCSGAKAAAW